MTVIHRDYGQGTMTAHGMTGQPMRYRLEVYRDARGIICDGPRMAKKFALQDKLGSL